MSKKNSVSVVTEILKAFPSWRSPSGELRPQMYFKSSLTALSHAMEDQVLASSENPLIIATFQKEKFYKQEEHRYTKIGHKSNHVYVLAAPENEFKNNSDLYEKIAFSPQDSLAQEWHLVVIGQNYTSCLICREKPSLSPFYPTMGAMDNSRRFEGVWTFDKEVTLKAAEIMLKLILEYRPELKQKVEEALNLYCTIPQSQSRSKSSSSNIINVTPVVNPDPFVKRLITYLQAGQYKLIKANRFLSVKEKKERLLNSVIGALRSSLNPNEILQIAINKLGEGLNVCRCIIYRCQENDVTATIQHEFLNEGIKSIKGQVWNLQNNPLFQEVVRQKESVIINDVNVDARIQEESYPLQTLVQNCSIISWLLVPIIYQGKLLGIMEIHHCGPNPSIWKDEDITLVNAIATQVGVTIIQAESYANLEDLNEQLAALDRTRANLVAITGHELRTPLSTIQVCLESLAQEPDMPQELRQVMLDTALEDAERLRKLVQDFLTLSQLESGRVEWNNESLSLSECVQLALSHITSRSKDKNCPTIKNEIKEDLPLVQADGEWLVEVLTKLLDNACKFTDKDAIITLSVIIRNANLEVTISDNGRGIEPESLNQVFERFYQEEGALRRSTGGTGLGLAICRQIVQNWGGNIWAESEGKNSGSKFHFTIPIFNLDSFNTNKNLQKKNKKNSLYTLPPSKVR